MHSFKISPVQRALSFAGTVLIAATLFVGAASTAQPRGGAYYRATLTNPTSEPRAIAGSVVWNCNGTECSAPRGTSRPVTMCARLAREVGAVASFVADGRALDADELARCNAFT